MILARSDLCESQHWSDVEPYGKCLEQQGCNFIGEAVYHGMLSYVTTALQSDGSLINDRQTNQALLNCVLLPKPHVEEFRKCSTGVNVEMLELLLRRGANPNQLWRGYTPWQRLLTLLHKHNWYVLKERYFEQLESNTLVQEMLLNWSGVVKLLLQHGANANTTCIENHVGSDAWGIPFLNSHHTVLDVIEHVFRKDVPEEAAELTRMVQESADGRTPLPNRPQQRSTEQNTGAKRVLELDEDDEPPRKRYSR
ncbi:hypothetical protein IFR05_014687 [Cadophora sp. M221]|nr:hypothetical protein IFR05_014687 [Cadophora sp. M221]